MQCRSKKTVQRKKARKKLLQISNWIKTNIGLSLELQIFFLLFLFRVVCLQMCLELFRVEENTK